MFAAQAMQLMFENYTSLELRLMLYQLCLCYSRALGHCTYIYKKKLCHSVQCNLVTELSNSHNYIGEYMQDKKEPKFKNTINYLLCNSLPFKREVK